MEIEKDSQNTPRATIEASQRDILSRKQGTISRYNPLYRPTGQADRGERRSPSFKTYLSHVYVGRRSW